MRKDLVRSTKVWTPIGPGEIDCLVVTLTEYNVRFDKKDFSEDDWAKISFNGPCRFQIIEEDQLLTLDEVTVAISTIKKSANADSLWCPVCFRSREFAGDMCHVESIDNLLTSTDALSRLSQISTRLVRESSRRPKENLLELESKAPPEPPVSRPATSTSEGLLHSIWKSRKGNHERFEVVEVTPVDVLLNDLDVPYKRRTTVSSLEKFYDREA